MIGYYDYRLVALSVLIAVFASYTALDLWPDNSRKRPSYADPIRLSIRWLSAISGEKKKIPRNGLSVDLPNGVPKSNHVTARGFRGTAGRVLGEFCVVRAQEETSPALCWLRRRAA
jgi:hypothetical protein